VIFVLKYVSTVVFKGGILGGARQFWGNLYLNSTTVLFDTVLKKKLTNKYTKKIEFSCRVGTIVD